MSDESCFAAWCPICDEHHLGRCYPQQQPISDNNDEEDEEDERGCRHPNMESTIRTDYCPNCGYSFYYPSAH